MSGELVSSPHETLEELEEDAGARTCFPIARSYELEAGKLSPRDTAEAIKHAEPSLALFIAFTPFLRKGGRGGGRGSSQTCWHLSLSLSASRGAGLQAPSS